MKARSDRVFVIHPRLITTSFSTSIFIFLRRARYGSIGSFLYSFLPLIHCDLSDHDRVQCCARCHGRKGRSVVEFGSRRAHGPEARVLAARAAYIGSCTGISNVEAGRRYGVPVFGTLAPFFRDGVPAGGRGFPPIQPVASAPLRAALDTYDSLAAISVGKIAIPVLKCRLERQ